MNHAEGILTVRGGMTSHAAVVARGMGRSCVSGCGELVIDEDAKTLTTKSGKVYHEGDEISLDGSTGRVYDGLIKTEEPSISGDFETFMTWADETRRLKVRTNADTPRDAKQARMFGAEGIGLCRTEHMFFEEDRIFNFRKMITAETLEQREAALEDILPYQRGDFEELFKAMAPYSVTIRFLDPPLHEFLPHTDEEIKSLADALGMTFDALKSRVESLKEFNPMMGHRGCRLAVTYPEIARMQTRAVIEAAINVGKEGIKVTPEIMIPLVGDAKELKFVRDIEVDEAGKLITYDIFESVIRSRIQMTYKKVNSILENKGVPEGYEPYVNDLKLMAEFASILRKAKLKRGYLDFDVDEPKILVDANGKPTDIVLRDRGIGENLIEDFMIAANECVASHIYYMNLPFIYRVHEYPKEEKLRSFLSFISNLGYSIPGNIKDNKPTTVQRILNYLHDKPEFPILSSLLLRSMQKAIYLPQNLGHYGLASPCYTHFTSPIRR